MRPDTAENNRKISGAYLRMVEDPVQTNLDRQFVTTCYPLIIEFIRERVDPAISVFARVGARFHQSPRTARRIGSAQKEDDRRLMILALALIRNSRSATFEPRCLC